MPRWVLHMDMDAFFASVEQLTRPTLRARPVLVGGAGLRGTVAGASYQARAYGARSAMPMAQARRLCPPAVVLPPRFRVYQEASHRVFEIVQQVAPVLEHISIDEAFMEPPVLEGASVADVAEFCAHLRARIRAEVGLPASVGAGSGKQLAKIASELAKPDGLRVIEHGTERAILDPLSVRALWGIGPVTAEKLHRIGVDTVGQLARLPLTEVVSLLGKAIGTELHRLAQGVDNRPVSARGEAKQVSAETTFEVDILDPIRLAVITAEQAEHAHRRLLASARAARTVSVKIRDSDFATISRSETMPAATTSLEQLTVVAQRLVRTGTPSGTAVRLIGVSLSGLATTVQETLFTEEQPLVEERPVSVESPQPSVTLRGPGHWRAGEDVLHPELGHGWVQGAGSGRVTVRFETADSGPGQAQTFGIADPSLTQADPVDSLPRRTDGPLIADA
ncbi:DNA polymerase IV [Pseudonocardiaceae bacterium YIM PH 21723]|nr:DNA polymerase IV [Pseudonocardiaceae bacterium YIM PH 21723]